MLAASFGFACLGLVVKGLSGRYPPGELVLWRSAASTVLLLALTAGRWGNLRPVNVKVHLLRGVVGIGAMVCYFTALDRLPLGDAVLLTYLSPLMVATLARRWLGETTSLRTWAGLGLGLVGVAAVIGPEGRLDPIGVAAGLVAAVCSAAAYISVRVLTRTDRTESIVIGFAIIGTALASVSLVDGATVPLGWGEVAALCAIGALGTAAQWGLTRAYAVSEAAKVAVFSYSTPLFAYVLGLQLGEVPPPEAVAGALLIFFAGWIATRGSG